LLILLSLNSFVKTSLLPWTKFCPPSPNVSCTDL
jgi:hypothetical protein